MPSQTETVEISAPPENLPADSLDPRLGEVLSFWLEKAAQGQAPSRRDLDPVKLRKALPWIVLWDVEPEGYRCRLAGTKVCEYIGTELRGVSLDELLQDKSSPVHGEFDTVRDRRVAHHVARQLTWPGLGHHRYRRLLLPLVDDAGKVATLLSAITIDAYDA